MRVYVHFPIDKCRIWKNVQPYTESKKMIRIEIKYGKEITGKEYKSDE